MSDTPPDQTKAESETAEEKLEAAMVAIQTASHRLRQGNDLKSDAGFADTTLYEFLQGKEPVCYVPKSQLTTALRENAELRGKVEELTRENQQVIEDRIAENEDKIQLHQALSDALDVLEKCCEAVVGLLRNTTGCAKRGNQAAAAAQQLLTRMGRGQG
jgi:hypothetical protein